jgi:hypothetical protein
MKLNDLSVFLEAEFGKVLKREPRGDGYAYYWHEIKKRPASTRLIRITKTAAGDVGKIKLAQSSIAADRDIFLPLPTSPEQVAEKVRTELARLLCKQ